MTFFLYCFIRDGNGSPFALAKVSESDWEMLRISFCGMCCYVTLVQYLGLCLLVHKTLSRPLFVYIYALYMFLLVVLFCVGKMHLLASIHDKRWILWIDLPLACSFVVVVVFTFLPDMPFWYRVFGVACNLPTIAVFVYDVAQCVRELLCLRKVPV